ncbi:hypothetical protein U370_02940 [Anaplasma marginale str. Dawn]|nr:hypothetical protein U370_02940 [Anaplasma marginale str. Dawn]
MHHCSGSAGRSHIRNRSRCVVGVVVINLFVLGALFATIRPLWFPVGVSAYMWGGCCCG